MKKVNLLLKVVIFAEKLFKGLQIRTTTSPVINPLPMIIYCYRKDTGFSGDEIGLSSKMCNDFFQTTTDSGICLTKNLDVKSIFKPSILDGYETLFESATQSNKKIESGTIWGEVSLLIDTHQFEVERKQSNSETNKIQLQLHQPKELATMHTPDNYDPLTIPLTLEANHEYHIQVTPIGKETSNGIRQLPMEHRKCKLETEILDTSVFTIYTEANCRYDCQVKLSAEICQCVPWDYMRNFQAEECDIFGRTCFYESMKNLSQYPVDQCPECLTECDYLRFEKKISEFKPLSYYKDGITGRKVFVNSIYNCNEYHKPCTGQEALIDYVMDPKDIIVEKGFKNYFYIMRKNENFTLYRAKKFVENAIIIHFKFLKPEIDFIDVKYSFMDKLATFGGNFGIFEMVTGWSLFGILNLILMISKLFFGFNHN